MGEVLSVGTLESLDWSLWTGQVDQLWSMVIRWKHLHLTHKHHRCRRFHFILKTLRMFSCSLRNVFVLRALIKWECFRVQREPRLPRLHHFSCYILVTATSHENVPKATSPLNFKTSTSHSFPRSQPKQKTTLCSQGKSIFWSAQHSREELKKLCYKNWKLWFMFSFI